MAQELFHYIACWLYQTKLCVFVVDYNQFNIAINNGSRNFCKKTEQVVHSTYLALPAIFGDGDHGWLEAKRMVALITSVTHQHLVVISGLSAMYTKVPVLLVLPIHDPSYSNEKW